MKNHIKTITYIIIIGVFITGYSQTVINNANVTISGLFTPAAPVIDGSLNDACWKNATLGGEPNLNAYNTSTEHFFNLLTKVNNINDNGVATGTPNTSPALPGGVSASFSTVWDTDYLYFIVKVKDSRVVGKSDIKGAEVEIYFNNGTARSAFNPGAENFPVKYNNEKDMQAVFGFSKHSTTEATLISRIGGAGITLSASSNAEVAYKGTTDGYIMEGKILWSTLNKEFVNPLTGVYSDLSKMPFNNNLTRTLPFGFDVGINVPNAEMTSRAAQMMWNQCCWNTNWTQSQHFGVLSLTGIPKIFTPTGVNISAVSGGALVITSSGTPLALQAIINPDDAPQGVKWSVSGLSNSGFPLAIINQFGVLSPLNDGIATVTATTFPRTVVSPFATIVPELTTITTVTISNQQSVTGITISAATITTNWATSQPTSSPIPADAPAQVTWSLIQTTNLATINSVTGLVTSLALGNGNITVVGTSLANGVKGYYVLSLIQQDPINCFVINAYSNINQANRTNNRVTFSGFNPGAGVLKTKIPLVFQYINKYEVTAPGIGSVSGYNISLIPNELINLTASFIPSVSGQIEYSGGIWYISFNNSNAGDATLIATYKNSSTVQSTVVGSVKSIAPSTVPSGFCAFTSGYDVRRLSTEAIQPGCNPGYVLPIADVCTSINEEKINSQFSVAPNPTTDAVSVSAPVAVSGLKVYSLTGVEVASSSTTSVSLSGASAGVYILEISTANGSVFKRVIKE